MTSNKKTFAESILENQINCIEDKFLLEKLHSNTYLILVSQYSDIKKNQNSCFNDFFNNSISIDIFLKSFRYENISDQINLISAVYSKFLINGDLDFPGEISLSILKLCNLEVSKKKPTIKIKQGRLLLIWSILSLILGFRANEELDFDNSATFLTTANMLLGMAIGHHATISKKYSIQMQGALAMLEKSPKQKSKNGVYEYWLRWQENNGLYKNKSEFARDMIRKFGEDSETPESEQLANSEVVKRWCKQWTDSVKP